MPEVQKARYTAALPLRPCRLGRDRAVRMRQERAADRLRRRKIPHQRALRRVRRRASGGVRRGPAARRRGHRPRLPRDLRALLLHWGGVRRRARARTAADHGGKAVRAGRRARGLHRHGHHVRGAQRIEGDRRAPARHHLCLRQRALSYAGASRRRRPHLRGLRREAAHPCGNG